MVLFAIKLRGIVQEGDARVKAPATVEHHRTVLGTGGQNHSFLSLQIESGFKAILSFLSKLSQALCFGGGRVTPSARAYFFSPLKISPETGGHRLVLSS